MRIGNLLSLSMKDAGILGVGQTASDEDYNDALDTLNMMLDSWAVESLMIYSLIETVASVNGQTATIGPGADIDMSWPEAIESMFYRLGEVDYPMIEVAKQDFDGIRFKPVGTIPRYFYNDREFPVATLHFFPYPIGGELHITTWNPITKFSGPEDEITFPPGYLEALRLNLAMYLANTYGMPQQAQVLSLKASLAKKRVKRLNTRIPRLAMPAALQRDGRFAGPAGFLAGD